MNANEGDAMIETDPEVLAAFAEEAAERVGALEAGLLELERLPHAPQGDLLNAVFRDAHSIKAGANLLHLRNLETAAHRLENVLDSLRKGQLEAREDVTQALLDGVDLLRELLGNPTATVTADMHQRLAVLEALPGRSQESV
ncbi:MAG: chemotaxis protein CheA [Deltaproteobacteria bacterium HGW-Deltaproteobacteria-8]|jgi:two-component system chemotaxis sensor kinase CheA|nr:MAG: chemotaxis protein CheA [Deltaproteobacteria bacterium HGW-Deltaproteobacteria-8]